MNYNETITLKNSADFPIWYINRWEIENYGISPQSLKVEIKNGDLVVNDKLFKKNERPAMKSGDQVKVYYFKAEIGEEVPTAKENLTTTITL